MLPRALSALRSVQRQSTRSIGNFEPQYLELLKPPLPVYEGRVNVQLKGYDYAVLEQQTRKIVKIANGLDIEVSEVWATPAQSLDVHTFKPYSVITDKNYALKVYERNVQLNQLSGAVAGAFIELLQKTMAEGITVSIHEHLPEHDEIRQIPDLELEAMERELAEINDEDNKNPHHKKPTS